MKTTILLFVMSFSAMAYDDESAIDYYNQWRAQKLYEYQLQDQRYNEEMQRVYQQMQEEREREFLRQQQNQLIIQQKSSLFPYR